MTLPIDVWVKSWPYPTRKERTRQINVEKESAWIDGECLWKQHGVWSVHPKTGAPQVERSDYFTKDPASGEKVDFYKFYLEFVNKYSRAIQSVVPSAFVFVGPIPNEPAPVWGPADHEDNIVYAPHWYDLHSIFSKTFDGRITHNVQGLSRVRQKAPIVATGSNFLTCIFDTHAFCHISPLWHVGNERHFSDLFWYQGRKKELPCPVG